MLQYQHPIQSDTTWHKLVYIVELMNRRHEVTAIWIHLMIHDDNQSKLWSVKISRGGTASSSFHLIKLAPMLHQTLARREKSTTENAQ